jgi:uncharacterized coiled-coil DUF342 family protein
MADLTTKILIEIRDEIRTTRSELSDRIDQTNARLDQTNARLDQTNTRLDQTNTRMDRLERRQVEGELRIGTEIAKLTGVMSELNDTLRADFKTRDVVLDHERRLTALEAQQG